MTLIQTANNKNIVVDCNITDNNEGDVFNYLLNEIGESAEIDIFICSHRDETNIRGIKKLHAIFPIRAIHDNDYPGTSTGNKEYKQYMDLRRKVRSHVIEKKKRRDFDRTRLRYLSARDNRLANNANSQGIVIKVEHLSSDNSVLGSVMLAGDSDAETWKDGILIDYSKSDLECDILVAGRHGSTTFFVDPDDEDFYYVDHIEAMNPAMTIVSVGDNPHGHPNPEAIKLYKINSRDSKLGNKVVRTDEQGHIRLHLKDDGGLGIRYR